MRAWRAGGVGGHNAYNYDYGGHPAQCLRIWRAPGPCGASPTQPYKCCQYFKVKVKTIRSPTGCARFGDTRHARNNYPRPIPTPLKKFPLHGIYGGLSGGMRLLIWATFCCPNLYEDLHIIYASNIVLTSLTVTKFILSSSVTPQS